MWDTKQAPGEAVLLALTVEAANVRPSTPTFILLVAGIVKYSTATALKGPPHH
jgi:hypothetical protein